MKPTNSPWRRVAASLSVAVVCAGLIVTALAAAADSGTQYSGRSTGVSIHTAVLDASFADTGNLPSAGGELDATFVQVDTSLAKADILLSDTMGFDSVARSESAVATVDLLTGTPNEVTADFVRSQSVATCRGVSALSELVNLRAAGQDVVVGTAPNQIVSVPGVLTLVINEQIDGSHDGTSDITVNALHLTLATGEEVIVSHAHSDIRCGASNPIPKDFVTGGGFIDVSGGTANFGFVAGFKPGATSPTCHLTYIDHAAGLQVKMSDITDYRGSGTTRTFKGAAIVNGASGYTATVTVTDGGEPGRGVDSIQGTLSSEYDAGGLLAGGNIQLHA